MRAPAWPVVVAVVVVVVVATAACEPQHVAPYREKERDVPVTLPPERGPNQDGSLWREGQPPLFADARAYEVADIVVVEIEEEADAQRSSDVGIRRDSKSGAFVRAVPIIGPLADLVTGDLEIDASASSGSDTSFQSEGRTGRSERLIATVPAVVKRVLPNGNLIIEGHRVVLVNDEEQHLYVSGVVRPFDIDANNRVLSSRIASAEIEFVGRGVVTDNQRQGILSRYLGWIWPF